MQQQESFVTSTTTNAPFLGLDRGTPGFWQGGFNSNWNGVTKVYVGNGDDDDDAGADEEEQEGEFGLGKEEEDVEELHNTRKCEDTTDFQGQGQGDAVLLDEAAGEAVGFLNDKEQPTYKGQRGGRWAGSSPHDDRKSVKNRYHGKVSQQKRREELLDSQKQRREEMLDKIRQLETSSDSEFEEDADEDFVKLVKENKLITEENEQSAEQMDTTGAGGNNRRRRKNYKRPNKNRTPPCRVMLSEWLIDKPTDLNENWLGMLCPVGKRCLVVASRGKTSVYSRTNEYMGRFQSLLPGGHKLNHRDPEIKKKKGVTILDCIWSMEAEEFYVLDLVCWASQSCNNCDKEYRQFFLTSKLSESSVMERSFSNPYSFTPLPAFDCGQIAEVMMTSMPIFKEKVDGVLFFHKQSFYFNGVNPLCLWIYLTDIENKLQVSVAPELAALQRLRPQRAANMQDGEKQKPMEVQIGA